MTTARPEARRWILALAAPVDTLAIDVASADRFGKALAKLEREGTEAARAAIDSLPSDPGRDNARHAVVRRHRTELSRAGLAAWDAARFVAAAQHGLRANLVDEAELWPRLLLLGHGLQKTYKSWRQFGEAFELGQRFMRGGVADAATLARLEQLQSAPDGAWCALAWKLDLGLAGKPARARYKRSTCGLCGGVKQQPSRTAYVYCDYCGELCDYDYSRVQADARGAPAPTVEEERAYESLRRRLEQARARGDRSLYRKLQAPQYERFADTAAHLLSPRIAEPGYRAAWIAFAAESVTAFAFDDALMQLDAAYHARVAELVIIEVKGKRRIVPASFAPVADAYVARIERLAEVYAEHDVLARHPDGLTAETWRRIEYALFLQQWIALLDEDTVTAMTARLGLSATFDAVPRAKLATLGCPQCSAQLSIAAGARRVVCEHCGHRHELVAR